MSRRVKIALLAVCAALAGLQLAAAQVQPDDGNDLFLVPTGRAVTAIPATTPGPFFEDTPNTVLHWSADRWNPLQFSNDLTNASNWLVHGGTATGGQQDPFGGMTATAIVEDGSNTYRSLSQAVVNVGGTTAQTYSVYVKPGSRSWVIIQLVSGPACYFNLTGNGSVGSCPVGGGVGSIAPAANGYYRISVTGTVGGLGTCTLTAAAADGQTNYQGTLGTTAITFYGPQVTRGYAPLPYRSEGATFAMQGTVPLVTASPLFPTSAVVGRRFVGPFSDANQFTAAAGSPMQFPGGVFTICVAYAPNTATNSPIFIANGGAHGSGYQMAINTIYVKPTSGSSVSVSGGATWTVGLLNVQCAGLIQGSPGTIYMKINAGVTGTASITGFLPANDVVRIGAYNIANRALDGKIYEVWMTTTPWNEATIQAIQVAALAKADKGAVFPDDAGTVLHLVGDNYDGAAWWSPQMVMTTVGVPPYSSAYVPPAPGNLHRQSYGAFGDTTYFSLGSGSDALDFAGDFSACFVFGGLSSYSMNPVIFNNGTYPNTGYAILHSAGGGFRIANWNGTEQGADTANVAVNGINVGCAGRAGTTLYSKLNLGTIVSAGGATVVTAPATTAFLGRYAAGGQAFAGSIYEAWFSTDTPSDALFTKIQRRALQHLSAQGLPTTTTRTSGATYELSTGGALKIYTVPGGVTVAPPDGSEIWRTSTNLIQQSSAFDQAVWTKTGTAGQEAQVTATDSAVAPDGTQTADTIYLSTITTAQRSQVYQAVNNFGALAVVPHTTTVWVKGVSTSDTVYIRPWIAALGRMIASGPCAYNPTTWTRCSLVWTPDAASTPAMAEIGQVFTVHGAQNEKKFYMWGFQTEATPYATPYIATAGTNGVRNGSAITIANLLPANVANWCLRFTARPGVAHSWFDGQSHTFLSSGAYGSANSFHVTQDAGGSLTFEVYDAATTVRSITTAGFADSEAHEVAVCTGNGTPSITVDGARGGGAVVGVGTAVISAPQSTMYLGSLAGSSNWLDGAVRNVVACDAPVGACTPPSIPTTLGYFAFDRTGEFETDAGTVANVRWSGSATVDTHYGWINLAQRSEGMDASPWATSGSCTVTPDQGTLPSKTTATMDLIQCTGSSIDARYQYATIASSAGPFTASAWVAADAGTKVESIAGICLVGPPLNCTCIRSDSGVCTIGYDGAQCYAYGSFTTTPVRMSLTFSCTGASTTVGMLAHDGQYRSTSNVGGLFGGWQLEPGAVLSPYCATAGAAVASCGLPAATAGRANVWTTTGVVPVNLPSPFFPNGFSGTALNGAGPFDLSNYIALGSGPDPLDFTGDFSACLAYSADPVDYHAIYSNGSASGTGGGIALYQLLNKTFGAQIGLVGGGSGTVTTANGAITPGVNVACYGMAGTTLMAKLNLGTIVTSTAAGTRLAGVGYPAYIGRYIGGVTDPFTGGKIYAMWFSTTTPSDALFTKQMNRFFGTASATGDVVTTTRSTVASAVGADGNLTYWPAGMPRVACDGTSAGKCGLLIEPARTNLILDSEEISTTAGRWTVAGTPATVNIVSDQYAGPHGLMTMDKLTVTTARHAVYQTAGTGTATAITGSAWVRSDTGTLDVSIVTECNGIAVSACTCARSDGGPCTTAIFTTPERCAAAMTATTTPVRLSATATCSAPTGTGVVYLSASNYVTGAGTGSMGVGLVQLEVGPYASSYLPTTSTQTARSADAITATNPLAASNPSAWCVDATYVPESGRPWSTVENNSMWSFNTAYTLAGGRAGSSINGGTLRLYSESGSAAISYSHGLVAGTPTRVGMGASLPSAWISVNGVNTAVGTPTQTATNALLNLGASGSGPTAPWGGFIRNFRLCNSMCQVCR